MMGRTRVRRYSVMLGVLFAILATVTWRRSGDLFIDWGRELYTALSVSEGQGIPLDVLLLFGPVSPLINGTILRVVTQSTAAILTSNLVFLLVAMILVYDIASWLFGHRSAFMASVLFLFLSGFPHLVRVGNYNFLTPYSHGLTHGLVLGLLALASVFRALRRDNPVWWSLAGVATGLAVCTKPETGLSALLMLFAAIILGGFLRSEKLGPWIVAPVSLAVALGITAHSVNRLTGAPPSVVFEPYRSAAEVASLDYPFYRLMGEFGGSLARLLVGLGVVVFLALFVLLPGRHSAPDRRSHGRPIGTRVRFWSSAAGGALFLVLTLSFPFAWLQLAKTLPWVTVGTFLLCLRTIAGRRRGLSRNQIQRAAELGLLALFSTTLLAKMGLDPHFDHYGFALAAPACLLGFGLLSHDLPARVRLARGLSLRARCVAPALTVFLVLSAASQSAAFYVRRTHPVGVRPDRMLAFAPEFDPRSVAFSRTLDMLSGSRRFRTGAVVLPEGSMFHYMLRAPSAIPVASLMPLEIQVLGDDRVIRLIESGHPDLIVFIEPDFSSWEIEGLHGTDPYTKVRTWIENEYCRISESAEPNSGPDRLQVTVFEPCYTSLRAQRHPDHVKNVGAEGSRS